MSEEQRYSKEGRAGWDPSVGQGNKGEKRQNAWTNNLRSILSETTNIDSDVRNIINTILNHENIPRKKPKFINFIKNIMGHKAGMHSIDKTWDLFSQALKPPTPPQHAPDVTTNGEAATVNGSGENKDDKKMEVEVEEPQKKSKKEKKKKKNKEDSETVFEVCTEKVKKSKKSKKKKENEEETSEKENKENTAKKRKIEDCDETMEVENGESSPKKSKFDWDEVITACLQSKEGNEMKLVKLKKKCVNEYFSRNEGTHKSKEDIGAKFDKKLKKRKYKILKDRVKLSTEEESPQNEQSSLEDTSVSLIAPPQDKEKAPSLSFNKWEATDFGSSAQTEKFRRLMGIKSAPPPTAVKTDKRDNGKIFRDLEQGFEKARQAHFGGRCFDV